MAPSSCALEIYSGKRILRVRSFETSPAMRSRWVDAVRAFLLEFSSITSLLALRMSESMLSSVVLAFLTSALS